MPVLDHETHESVIEKEGAKYGCWNKPRPTEDSSYLAQDGWETQYVGSGDFEGTAWFVEVRNVMSTECRYDMSLKDAKCDGCEWRGSGERYDEEIRSRGR
jgi:hypothetical protein